TVYAKWFEGDAPTIYTVSFETNGGTAITAQHIISGQKATRPGDPSKVGSVFGGWYSDSALTTAFSFDTPITADTVIYAKWVSLKTSVTLKDSSITLRFGESKKLEATVTPDDAADKSLTWTSADAGIARVDADGTVTAVKPGETTITATCNSGGEKAECKVVVERKCAGDDDLTTRISDMDIDKYVIAEEKTVSVNFSAKLSKNETKEASVGFCYLDAISYTGKKISPDMLKTADNAEFINLSGVLKAAGVRDAVKAGDILNVKYTSSKNKDAGQASFYAKLSVKKTAKNYMEKSEIAVLKKVVAAANKELKKKANRIKYTINPASLADMSSIELVAKTNKDGSFSIKDGSLKKIKALRVKFKATDEKSVKVSSKLYFTSNAKEDGTVKLNGKKNFTGCVTVKAQTN
nr:Ig-like domain-containing protein [Lachnospiraceae bacterium]